MGLASGGAAQATPQARSAVARPNPSAAEPLSVTMVPIAPKANSTLSTPKLSSPKPSTPTALPASPILTTQPGYFAQLGAFKDAAAAERLTLRAAGLGLGEVLRVQAGEVVRVMLGPYADRSAADAAGKTAGGALGVSAFIHERK
jgi:rare lipoprotein A